MADTRRPTVRKDAKPSLVALVAIAAMACALPSGAARAERQETGPGVAEITSAIGRGIATVQEGIVSWYGAQFHNRRTASGERFDQSALTMAHPNLPFGTVARVTNLRNGRSVVVRVNDRGPFVGKRIADLSQAAADELGMLRKGLAKVRIEVLGEEDESVAELPAGIGSDSPFDRDLPPIDTGPKAFTSAP
jgi:rare lipoprotein A